MHKYVFLPMVTQKEKKCTNSVSRAFRCSMDNLPIIYTAWTARAILCIIVYGTIKGGSRRAEKSRKVLMMMKAAKLGWAGSGAG